MMISSFCLVSSKQNSSVETINNHLVKNTTWISKLSVDSPVANLVTESLDDDVQRDISIQLSVRARSCNSEPRSTHTYPDLGLELGKRRVRPFLDLVKGNLELGLRRWSGPSYGQETRLKAAMPWWDFENWSIMIEWGSSNWSDTIWYCIMHMIQPPHHTPIGTKLITVACYLVNRTSALAIIIPRFATIGLDYDGLKDCFNCCQNIA